MTCFKDCPRWFGFAIRDKRLLVIRLQLLNYKDFLTILTLSSAGLPIEGHCLPPRVDVWAGLNLDEISKLYGLYRVVQVKASFWGLLRTNFWGHFHKLFLFIKFNFSEFREKVSLTVLRFMCLEFYASNYFT